VGFFEWTLKTSMGPRENVRLGENFLELFEPKKSPERRITAGLKLPGVKQQKSFFKRTHLLGGPQAVGGQVSRNANGFFFRGQRRGGYCPWRGLSGYIVVNHFMSVFTNWENPLRVGAERHSGARKPFLDK